ncbi:uncharacterized protein LOC143226265 [Tachypleus tridentatus]|uniref:uncharacterized protein LOC143226265 n=1 Tax=Tachypleus tridentatus TaxID=6853 RepID=UPI003FD1AFC5
MYNYKIRLVDSTHFDMSYCFVKKLGNVLKNCIEHKQPGDEKITTYELDILEAMPLITECGKKVPTKNIKKTKTNILRKKKVTKRTTLETIYENDLEERNTLIIQRYLNCYTFVYRIQRLYLPLKKLIYCSG